MPRSFHEEDLPCAPSPKSLGLRCVQNGSSARREEGAYLDRYVTDEQRSSRPIFNATPWAGAGWPFFCVARSAVMIQIAALRSRLEKQPTGLRRNPRDLGDRALETTAMSPAVLCMLGPTINDIVDPPLRVAARSKSDFGRIAGEGAPKTERDLGVARVWWEQRRPGDPASLGLWTHWFNRNLWRHKIREKLR
jgi:hypothetical protein